MKRGRRRKQYTTPEPRFPAHALGFAKRGRRLLTEHLRQLVHLTAAQLDVTRCLLLHTHQRRGDCTTFQGIIARESSHGPRTVRRTERDLERHGLLRIAYHHGLRRLWWSKLFLTLARDHRLPPRVFFRVFGALVLHIHKALQRPAPDHRRPRAADRPERQNALKSSDVATATAQPQDQSGTQPTDGHEDRPRLADNTSLSSRERERRDRTAAEASLPDGREPQALTPPAPTGQEHTATPPPARVFDPVPGRPTAALAFGEAPAISAPVAGGPGEGPTPHAALSPNGDGDKPPRDLAARAALGRRFHGDDCADLRRDLQRLHDLMRPGPLPEVLPHLVTSPIVEALACSDEDADFLARRYFERLRDHRRHQPRGPRPVPRTVLTDATGRDWMLDWLQPAQHGS